MRRMMEKIDNMVLHCHGDEDGWEYYVFTASCMNDLAATAKEGLFDGTRTAFLSEKKASALY
jgi:hypothetical protein